MVIDGRPAVPKPLKPAAANHVAMMRGLESVGTMNLEKQRLEISGDCHSDR